MIPDALSDRRVIDSEGAGSTSPIGTMRQTQWVRILVVLLWAWMWLPSLLNAFILGPLTTDLGGEQPQSAAAGAVFRIIIYAVIAVSIVSTLDSVAARATLPILGTVILLAPWFALNASYVFEGGTDLQVLIFPLVVVAMAFNSRGLHKVYPLLRGLIVVSAAASIALGVIRPDIGLAPPDLVQFNEKAIIGDRVLAGIFSQSNQLGINMALGIPLILLTSCSRRRWAAVTPAAIALIWSSSRTSLGVTLVALSVMFVARQLSRTGRRQIYLVSTFISGSLVLIVPLAVSDPTLFTGRGAVWLTSLDLFRRGDFFRGLGTMIYRETDALTDSLAFIPNHGHNVFVTVITVGGVISLTFAVLLWVAFVIRASRIFAWDEFSLVFVMTLTMLSVIEDPLRAFIVAPASFIVIPLMTLPFVFGAGAARSIIGSPDRGIDPNAVEGELLGSFCSDRGRATERGFRGVLRTPVRGFVSPRLPRLQDAKGSDPTDAQ